jgi:hypothetical protein
MLVLNIVCVNMVYSVKISDDMELKSIIRSRSIFGVNWLLDNDEFKFLEDAFYLKFGSSNNPCCKSPDIREIKRDRCHIFFPTYVYYYNQLI